MPGQSVKVKGSRIFSSFKYVVVHALSVSTHIRVPSGNEVYFKCCSHVFSENSEHAF